MSEADLYREHRVFRWKPHGAVVYVCFERLSDGRFVVQQAEFVNSRDNAERASQANRISSQTLELFSEGKVNDSRQWFASIPEAVEAHDREFEN